MQDTAPTCLAPELLDNPSISTASDVFALGMVLWELLTCRWVMRAGGAHRAMNQHWAFAGSRGLTKQLKKLQPTYVMEYDHECPDLLITLKVDIRKKKNASINARKICPFEAQLLCLTTWL